VYGSSAGMPTEPATVCNDADAISRRDTGKPSRRNITTRLDSDLQVTGWHVCLLVCLLATLRKNFPADSHKNFQGRLAMDQSTSDYILMAIRITVWIQGLFSRFVTIERYGKWLTDIHYGRPM